MLMSKAGTGLVSITFRQSAPETIIGWVKRTRLQSIEWGGDVHVPHGDVRRAGEVGSRTRESGLAVSAYGSYYGRTEGLVFERVLDTAVALGAPVIRVWAGRRASAEADPEDWARVVDDTRRIAGIAAATGRKIAFEFHANTLADTDASCLRLLQAVRHPSVFAYWQPPVGADFETCMAGLERLLPHVIRVHVFHWHPATVRQPLVSGRKCWVPYLRRLREGGFRGVASLEFVREDSLRSFFEDARTLADWMHE